MSKRLEEIKDEYSGKGVRDGRGLENLISQISPN